MFLESCGAGAGSEVEESIESVCVCLEVVGEEREFGDIGK